MRAILRSPVLIHLFVLAIPAGVIAYSVLAGPQAQPLAQWFEFANWFVLRAAIVLLIIAVLQLWSMRGKPLDERADSRLHATLLFGFDLAVVSNALFTASDSPAVGLLVSAVWAGWLVLWSRPRFRRTRLTSTFEIARSPQVVFSFISDSRNLPRWRLECKSVEMLTPAPIGPGTRFRQHAQLPDGRWAVGVEQIVDYAPDQRLISRVESSIHPNLDEITFEPVTAGTRVTERNDLEYSFGEAAIGAVFRRGNRAKVIALRQAGEIRIKEILEGEEFDNPAG